MATIILTGDAGYAEPTGTWGGTLGTERFINSAGSATFTFTGLTIGQDYAIAFAYVEFTNRVTNTAWSVTGAGTPSGTINQQVAPNSFSSGGNNYQFFNQKFTATATTIVLTIAYPASPNPGGNYTEVVGAWLDLVANVTPIPTVQSGDWGTAATWLFATVPATATVVSLGHDITISADRTVGDGSDTLFIDASSESGTLTITGAVLELKGHAQFGSDTTSATGTTRLTIQNSGSTVGGLRLNGNSGVTPHVLFGRRAPKLILTGQNSGNKSFIETKSGSAGNQGYLGQYASSTDYLSSLITHGQFTRIGNGSNDGFKCDLSSSSSNMTWNDVAIDANCVNVPSFVMGDGAATLSLNDSAWQNNPGKSCMSAANNSTAKTSGTWEINRCVFYGQPTLNSLRDVVIRDYVFDQYFVGNDDAVTWDLQYGVIRKSDGLETLMSGGLGNTFLLMDDNGSGAEEAFMHVSRLDNTITGNFFQRAVAGTGPVIALTEGGSQNRNITVTNNCVLKSSDGGSSGPLSSAFNNSTDSFKATLLPSHNTVLCPAALPAIGVFAIPMTGTQRVDELKTGKSNIFYRVGGSATSTFGIGQVIDASLAPPLTDSVKATEIDYNCNFGMDTVPAGHWSGTSGDTGVEDGSHYNSPMSGATAPGVHDVNVDPGFKNVNAGLEGWAVLHGSVSGTSAGQRADGLALIYADSTLTRTSLLPYLQDAMKVTNAALNNAGHDSMTIGAMGFQASGGGAAAWMAAFGII